MSWLLDALTDAHARADELERSHDTEHNGEHWTTPSILRDDGKETNGEETQRTTIRAPRT